MSTCTVFKIPRLERCASRFEHCARTTYDPEVPRDTLSRDQIVGAAIELLDARGLDDFSMRMLGKRLGSAATAMYWHVGSKDDLLALAADRVWSEIALP